MAVHRYLSVSTNTARSFKAMSYSSLFSSEPRQRLVPNRYILKFKTSLLLSPQVLAIVIRSHIFHVHLVTLLLKDKTKSYFSTGSVSATTSMTYCKKTTNNGRWWNTLQSLLCVEDHSHPPAVQLLLRPKSGPMVFMKSSLPSPTLKYALLSVVTGITQQLMGINTSSFHCQGCQCPTPDCEVLLYTVAFLWHNLYPTASLYPSSLVLV